MKSSSSMHSKKALVYFHCFSKKIGGSDYLPLLLIEELQRRGYVVVLALGFSSDLTPEQAAKLFQIELDWEKVNVQFIRPKISWAKRMDSILPFYRSRQLQRLAKQADVCISTANMIDFGKPAHHVVYLMRRFGDNAFLDFVQHNPPLSGFSLFKRKLRRFIAETFLRPLLGVRSARKILADQREHIYVPSHYVADTMQAFYGPINYTVFYPPTSFVMPPLEIKRDPLRVVYLGWIRREKGILEIIDIITCTRMLSNRNVQLFLAGPMEPTYAEKLKKIAMDNPWIQMGGPIFGQDKAAFLLSGTYAIHAERDEAFGISITEYLKAGCIPIVPDEGGTPEVVGNPALTYHTNEDAAKILTHLLSDEAFRQEQLNRCRERAKEYSFERYLETQHRILDNILERPI